MSNEKQVMTPDIMKDLAGLLPMSNDSVHKFIPKSFVNIPKEYQPIIHVTQFNRKESKDARQLLDNIWSSMSGDNKVKSTPEEDILKLLELKIKGWDNLKDYGDIDNKLIEFDVDMIKAIPDTILGEIFYEIVEITGIYPKQVFKDVNAQEVQDVVEEVQDVEDNPKSKPKVKSKTKPKVKSKTKDTIKEA